MDSFEINKVAGAVLGTLLLAMGSGFVAELIYHGKPAGKAGYELPEPAPEAHGGGGEAAKAAEPIAVRLASADPAKGQAGTKVCQACHSFEKGGPNKVGPDLWDVVERKKGGHEGFDYSAGMKEKGGSWTYEDLDHFIENPKAYVKGTKMAFAGLASPTERANVIAYLRTLSDSPKPLPAAEKTEAKPADAKPADAKPAEGKKDEAKKDTPKPAAEGDKKPDAAAKPPAEAPKPADAPKPPADAPKPEAKPAEAPKPAETAPAEAPKDAPAPEKH